MINWSLASMEPCVSVLEVAISLKETTFSESIPRTL